MLNLVQSGRRSAPSAVGGAVLPSVVLSSVFSLASGVAGGAAPEDEDTPAGGAPLLDELEVPCCCSISLSIRSVSSTVGW